MIKTIAFFDLIDFQVRMMSRLNGTLTALKIGLVTGVERIFGLADDHPNHRTNDPNRYLHVGCCSLLLGYLCRRAQHSSCVVLCCFVLLCVVLCRSIPSTHTIYTTTHPTHTTHTTPHHTTPPTPHDQPPAQF